MCVNLRVSFLEALLQFLFYQLLERAQARSHARYLAQALLNCYIPPITASPRPAAESGRFLCALKEMVRAQAF